MTLYEIDRGIEDILNAAEVDEATGEVIYDEAALEALQLEQAEKQKNIALLIKNLQADITALTAEEESFAQRRSAKEKKVAWLTSYLLKSLNGESIEFPEVSAACKINPEKVVWPKGKDKEIIEWCRLNLLEAIRTSVKEDLDKPTLKKAIAEGKKIPLVQVVREQTIKIK